MKAMKLKPSSLRTLWKRNFFSFQFHTILTCKRPTHMRQANKQQSQPGSPRIITANIQTFTNELLSRHLQVLHFFSPIEVICVSAASGLVQTHARRLFKSQPITWELRITFLCSNSFHFSSQRDGWKYVRMKKRCKGKPYKFERAERENEMSFDVVHATRLPWFASLLLLLPANKPFISNRRRREVRRRKLVPFRERWKAF